MKNTVLLTILLASALLFACLPSTRNGETQVSGDQWIQDLYCEFPCYQGISPDEIEFRNALPILQEAGFQIISQSENYIEFHPNENITGSVNKATDGSISFIVLVVMRQNVLVEDVIRAIGSPTEVELRPGIENSRCGAYILFAEKGTILELSLENLNKPGCQVSINSESKIFRIVLIKSYFDEYLSHLSPGLLSRGEWKGYGIYP
jgi:hypothetical protein